MQPLRSAIKIGTVFDQFQVVEKLGEGGMGVVYKVIHLNTRQYYAAKFAKDPEQERFHREAMAVAKVDQHPNIVKIHHASSHEGSPYLLFDFIEGEDLGRSHSGLLSFEDASRVLIKISEAVAFIHEKGLLHRDLKPENILIRESDGEPLLMDFGLARVEDAESLTKSQDLLGTPHYMSPEQLTGDHASVCEASDIWSLGVIYYELLLGQRPFEADKAVDLMVKIVSSELDLQALQKNCPKDITVIFQKTLNRDISQRYQSARELARDCRALLAGQRLRTGPSLRLIVGLVLSVVFSMAAGAVVMAQKNWRVQEQRSLRLRSFAETVNAYLRSASAASLQDCERAFKSLEARGDLGDERIQKHLGQWSLIQTGVALKSGDHGAAGLAFKQARRILGEDSETVAAYRAVCGHHQGGELRIEDMRALKKYLLKYPRHGWLQKSWAEMALGLKDIVEANRAALKAEALGEDCTAIRLHYYLSNKKYQKAFELSKARQVPLESSELVKVLTFEARRIINSPKRLGLEAVLRELHELQPQAPVLASIAKSLSHDCDRHLAYLTKVSNLERVLDQGVFVSVLKQLAALRELGLAADTDWTISADLREVLKDTAKIALKGIKGFEVVKPFNFQHASLGLRVAPELSEYHGLLVASAHSVAEKSVDLDVQVAHHRRRYFQMTEGRDRDHVWVRYGWALYCLCRQKYEMTLDYVNTELKTLDRREPKELFALLWICKSELLRRLKRPVEEVCECLDKSLENVVSPRTLNWYLRYLVDCGEFESAEKIARWGLKLESDGQPRRKSAKRLSKQRCGLYILERLAACSLPEIDLSLEPVKDPKALKHALELIGEPQALELSQYLCFGSYLINMGQSKRGFKHLYALRKELIERQPFRGDVSMQKVLWALIERARTNCMWDAKFVQQFHSLKRALKAVFKQQSLRQDQNQGSGKE